MIREAEPADSDRIAEEFWYPLARETPPRAGLNELTDDALDRAREAFARLVDEEDRYDLLLETDGEAVGYVSAELGERPTRRLGRYLEVVDLYVKPDHRNQGYGTRLLDRVERLAEAADCDFVRVGTEWENEGARRFYERHGYVEKQVTYAKPLD